MALRAIYYDTETTGIRPDRDRIIEVACYDIERDTSFVRFVNPGCPIPSEATAIHNITDEMVANASSFGGVAKEMIEFCDGEVVLIAHNNDGFDLPFLRNSFEREGVEWPAHWVFVDSLKWARRYRPDLPRHSLQFLREYMGFPPNQAHRALDDVRVLAQVFGELIDDLPMERVVELLYQKRQVARMPFGKHQGKRLEEVPKDYIKWLSTSGALDKESHRELRDRLEELSLL
jgi:DNA polymerase III subunit epsilon